MLSALLYLCLCIDFADGLVHLGLRLLEVLLLLVALAVGGLDG